MKKVLLLTVFLIILPFVNAKAENVIITKDTTNIESTDGLQLLNNLKPASFYNWEEGKWYWGGTTELYRKFYLALEAGVIEPLDADSSALFTLGINLLLGELLGDIEPVKEIASKIIPVPSLFNYVNIGAWGARNFNTNEFGYGFYTGAKIEFK